MNSNELRTTVQIFDDLTTRELYEILKARSAVFVVEQNCPYQDLDNIDLSAMHITLWNSNKVMAYCRVFKSEQHVGLWHIGRVITTVRNRHYGLHIMKEALRCAKNYGATIVEIEAQCQALGFYQKLGFQQCSAEFMLDGIPHKRMKIEL